MAEYTGRSKHPLNHTWRKMKQRCYSPAYSDYKNYGARGITIEWLSFEEFIEDMGERPRGMTLDRIDNNGNYSKENCRWAMKIVQANNTRRNHFINYKGERKTIAQWARSLDMKIGTLERRVNAYKWPIEKCFTYPVILGGNKRRRIVS